MTRIVRLIRVLIPSGMGSGGKARSGHVAATFGLRMALLDNTLQGYVSRAYTWED